jgi:hypothetical protein
LPLGEGAEVEGFTDLQQNAGARLFLEPAPSSLARRSGTTPSAVRTCATSGLAKSVALAVKRTRRGTHQPTTSASTSALG